MKWKSPNPVPLCWLFNYLSYLSFWRIFKIRLFFFLSNIKILLMTHLEHGGSYINLSKEIWFGMTNPTHHITPYLAVSLCVASRVMDWISASKIYIYLHFKNTVDVFLQLHIVLIDYIYILTLFLLLYTDYIWSHCIH